MPCATGSSAVRLLPASAAGAAPTILGCLAAQALTLSHMAVPLTFSFAKSFSEAFDSKRLSKRCSVSTNCDCNALATATAPCKAFQAAEV